MKKNLLFVLLITFVILVIFYTQKEDNFTPSSDKKETDAKTGSIVFGIEAMYPPFEFLSNGEIVGMDVDIANAIASELKKDAKFMDMKFDSLLPALDNNTVNAVISAITITEQREKNFDFSIPYYSEGLVVVFRINDPINIEDLQNKTIACQLGSTMQIWAKKHISEENVIAVDNNNQAIEMLKTGHVDGVIVNTSQGISFLKENQSLDYQSIPNSSNEGFGIAFKKGSPLKSEVDKAIEKIKLDGTLNKIIAKWIYKNDL